MIEQALIFGPKNLAGACSFVVPLCMQYVQWGIATTHAAVLQCVVGTWNGYCVSLCKLHSAARTFHYLPSAV